MTADWVNFDRDGVARLIGKMITQAVVLANHLKCNPQPYKSYVIEKLHSYPILDESNGAVFESIAHNFELHYGVDIRPSWLK